jgi:hypothetical protein
MISNCPKCNAPVGNTAEECPQCGILFSKWMQREENLATGNMSRYSIANATSSEFNWTILSIFCITLVGIFYFLQINN